LRKIILYGAFGVFIVSWKVTGQRPAPCPDPTPDAWGQYTYSNNFEKETQMRMAMCTENFHDWKVKSFDTQKELDEFMATKPAGVEHVEIMHIDDSQPKKGKKK